MKRALGRLAALSLAAVVTTCLSVSGANAAAAYPVNTDTVSGYATGTLIPDIPPAGANVGCRPSAAHPEPVILVHGTFANQNSAWQAAAPTLANAGYCVYTFTYGRTFYSFGAGGIADIAAGAQSLSAFVDQVLARTGATKVDLVGHSQGGLLPRYYIRFLGGAAKVDQLIGLTPSNYGTTLDGLTTITTVVPGTAALLRLACPACSQQVVGSDFLTKVNSGSPTQPGVRYTVIETNHDEVVTPYTNAFLPAAPNVKNVLWQDVCPADPVGHLGATYDTGILQYVLNTLDPSTAQPVTCVSGFSL